MKRILLLCVSFVIALQANAQFSKTPIFTDNDAINIDFNSNGYYYNHKIRKGHTVYGLSKVFNIPVDEIYMVNNITESTVVSVGDIVKIPVDPSQLIQTSYEPSNGVFVPVTYTVEPKETVFRIARMYFNQDIEDFKIRNGLANNNLAIGQKVKIGWMPIYEAKGPSTVTSTYNDTYTTTTRSSSNHSTSYQTHTTRPSSTQYSQGTTYRTTNVHNSAPTSRDVQYAVNSSRPISQADSAYAVSKTYPAGFRPDLLGRAKYVEGMTVGNETTVAHWDKTIPDNGVAYALHNNAAPNSYIEIYNPNLRRSVKAKVIGQIPFGSYTSDVQLVISPRAAQQLGGLDQRFRVEIKYINK